MSTYVKMKTGPKMTNRDMVVEALKRTGVPAEEIQVGDDLQLSGYQGASRAAHILVSKRFHNGYGDFGFVAEEGAYTMIVDDLDDKRSLSRRTGCAGQYSGYVSQWYTALEAQRVLRLDGFSTEVKKEADKVVVMAMR